MNNVIYNIALVIHVVGITLMAGATFIDFIIFRQFFKILPSSKSKGLVIEEFLNRLQRFMSIGMAIILISGIGMMVYLHRVWGQQTWFQLKMAILVLIIINGLGFRRVIGSKLKKLMVMDQPGSDLDITMGVIQNRISVIHIFQILFFLVIFALSIFKFN